jgi:hypothetical protein
MRAIETIGTIDTQGHIQLDTPHPQVASSRVRIVKNISPALKQQLGLK